MPAIVEYELRYGLLRWPQQAREARLAALSQLLRPMQMLPFDSECAAFAARIGVELEALSTPIECRVCSGKTGMTLDLAGP